MSRLPGNRESSKLKPAPLEKNFQARVNKKLKTLKRTWFVKVSDRVKNGIPDVLMCIDGTFVAMELKRSGAHSATPLQRHTLAQILDAGGRTYLVYPENFDLVFEELVEMAGGTK